MTTMRAVTLLDRKLQVKTVPAPVPQSGEVLVRTLATGICGSDLHAISDGPELVESMREVTGVDMMDVTRPVILGHEFCAEVLEYGPGTNGQLATGTRVVSFPMLLRPEPTLIGFGGVETPGGYGELMVLSEALLLPVPDNLSTDLAALTEPIAVALHAVNRAGLGSDEVPLVIGCGPIGLAIIAVLKMRGIGPIVAADFSPRRRERAADLGAAVVVDPRETSPYDAWQQVAATDDPDRFGRQTLMFQGLPYRPSVVFECTGVPGVLQQILSGAAAGSKVVVAGVCMEEDRFQPVSGLTKEIDVIFSFFYSIDEYVQTLNHLAAEELQVAPMITGKVGLDGVEQAVLDLGDPERHAKILIDPSIR